MTIYDIDLFLVTSQEEEKMAKNIDKTTIGGRIKAARKALGMTQEDLAELMCSTGALICCYEKDKVDLSLSVIRLLARHLQVSAAYLVDGIEDEMDEDTREMMKIFGGLKSDEFRKVALGQVKMLGGI